ncbi:MAG: hypothetical protein GTO14_10035, partial [Anaerolineales bacterium]|nr:hypothetical protein [Anaerolineales bacterium]
YSLLWNDAVQYQVDRDYLLTVDCQGSKLVGYLDGVQLFEVQDDDLTSGKVALYCWGNQQAIFKEVRVATPIWSSYYTFGSEARMAAGTRVRVYSGAPIGAPTPEAGMEQRFVAATGSAGMMRL